MTQTADRAAALDVRSSRVVVNGLLDRRGEELLLPLLSECRVDVKGHHAAENLHVVSRDVLTKVAVSHDAFRYELDDVFVEVVRGTKGPVVGQPSRQEVVGVEGGVIGIEWFFGIRGFNDTTLRVLVLTNVESFEAFLADAVLKSSRSASSSRVDGARRTWSSLTLEGR